MTKRCTDCKHTRGIGYDFWCGEGHTKYEVFAGETDCPYYEYHDWSKSIPCRNENDSINKDSNKKQFEYKRFKTDLRMVIDTTKNYGARVLTPEEIVELLNKLYEENNELKDKYNEQSVEYEGLEEQVERLQDFKDKVFNLINAEIRRGEQIIDGGERIGANVSAMVFHIVLLKRLKEGLI